MCDLDSDDNYRLIMAELEPHFFAAWMSSQVACEILEILPQSDLIEEIREILVTQLELFMHIVEGKHFGTDNLKDFIDFCKQIKSEALRIKEST